MAYHEQYRHTTSDTQLFHEKYAEMPAALQGIIVDMPDHAEVVQAEFVEHTIPDQPNVAEIIPDAHVVEDEPPAVEPVAPRFFDRVKSVFAEAKLRRPIRRAVIGLGAAAMFAYGGGLNKDEATTKQPANATGFQSVRHSTNPHAVIQNNTAILQAMLEQSRAKKS